LFGLGFVLLDIVYRLQSIVVAGLFKMEGDGFNKNDDRSPWI
jgi:hypothetical protein